MEIILWVLFAFTAFYGGICALAHWSFIFVSIYKLVAKKVDDKNYSFAFPYIGPWLLVAAAFLYPLEGLSKFWWLAFIVEPQYLIFAILFVIQKVYYEKRSS